MGVPMATERRVLNEAEFDVVKRTHYPAIMELSQDELAATGRRLRALREEARDLGQGQRQQRRATRRAKTRAAGPAMENAGLSRKRQVVASALKRVNRELARLAKDQQRAGQDEVARRALERKRADRLHHHPSAARTAGRGMRRSPSRAEDAAHKSDAT